MLSGRGADIKRHKWFEGMDWEALSNRRVEPGRKPREDSAKRLKELMVRCDLAMPAMVLLVVNPLTGTQTEDMLSTSTARRVASLPASQPNSFACLKSDSRLQYDCLPSGRQDAERKQKRDVRESPEELQECELVFGDF